ncbi:glutathione S-transferase C-terminal-like protein [Meredithblackwellia eburnea MCA 4105]
MSDSSACPSAPNSAKAQFTLYTIGRGPNGFKVAMVLKALGVSYNSVYLDFKNLEHKKEPYTKLNPNGKIPTLVDDETGFVLWESNAIILYLVDRFDKEHKISASTDEEKFKQLQWLFFQVSGQGVYFAQSWIFKHFHPERVPSAIERYEKEALRVFGVLETVLSASSSGWLVGNKVTVADISFVSWNEAAFKFVLPDNFDFAKAFPAVFAWHSKMLELDYVKATLEDQKAVSQV